MLDLADLWKMNLILFRSEAYCSRNLYNIEAATLFCCLSLLTRFCMMEVFMKSTYKKTIIELIFVRSKDFDKINIFIPAST